MRNPPKRVSLHLFVLPLAIRILNRKNRKMGKVVHCKREPYDVYIGRPSKWGNPFVIEKDGTRKEVIEKYKE